MLRIHASRLAVLALTLSAPLLPCAINNAHAAPETTETPQPQKTPAPDITTRQEQDRTLEEYRINGRLYAIKITPRQGEPYMLVDHNGDGNFQMERNIHVAVPQWTLIRW